jgi:hypothetical protein
MYWFYDVYDTICPVSWNYFDGNKASNSGRGVSMNVTVNNGSGAIPHSMCYGNVFRRNEFKDLRDYSNNKGTVGYGIYSGYAAMGNVWVGAWETANLFENNTFENCQMGNINLGPHQANNIYRKNIAKDGKPGPISRKLYDTLWGIQRGDIEDRHGWVTVME